MIGYSRKQALAQCAVLPVTFGALDGEASYREDGVEAGPHRLGGSHPDETTRPALLTALRTGFAEALLREAFLAIVTCGRNDERRGGSCRAPPRVASASCWSSRPTRRRPGKYLETVRSWIPASQAGEAAQLATSDTPRAHETLAAFRLRAEPSILVTVAMAYEGLDAPEVAVVEALTHIRARPWLEQMVARATRVDPNAGYYETQRALVFHPDDPLFAQFRRRIETEQGTLARRPRPARGQSPLPLWFLDQCKRPLRAAVIVVDAGSGGHALIKAGLDVGQVPGQQLGDAVHRVIGDAFDDASQVGFGIEPVQPGGRDE